MQTSSPKSWKIPTWREMLIGSVGALLAFFVIKGIEAFFSPRIEISNVSCGKYIVHEVPGDAVYLTYTETLPKKGINTIRIARVVEVRCNLEARALQLLNAQLSVRERYRLQREFPLN